MNQQLATQTPETKKPLISHGILQRRCACGKPITTNGECAACNKKRQKLQRKATNQHTPETAPPIVHEVLRGPGRPLDNDTRFFMESRFNQDFSQVRIHTGDRASESAKSINAKAYTLGSNVVFGSGEYKPKANTGKEILAHELTHVVQQNFNGQPMDLASPTVMPAAHPAEREALKAVQQLQAGSIIPSVSSQGISIQRQAADGAEEDGLLDKIASGVVGIAEEITEGVEAVTKGIVRGIRCSLPATENPLINPLSDMSTFQSPGGSGWRGAMFGCFRNNCSRRHRGWDIHAPVGTSARAVVEGTITHHQNPGGFGDYIRLRSTRNPDRTYIYAHLSQRELAGNYCVGDKLGETGVTGNASANRPHLHFEVRTNNAAQNPAGFLTEPARVFEQVGSAANAIDKTISAPCVPC
jgi:hypothetical protein